MAAGGLSTPVIDWQAPWLAQLRGLRQFVERADWREALSAEARRRGVATASGLPVEFVAPDDAGAAAYEAHIAATGRVPTRENAHDLFNPLVWLAFPLTKAALNVRQAHELARDGVRGTRGPVRDAATLIDESGLLLAASDEPVVDIAAEKVLKEIYDRVTKEIRDVDTKHIISLEGNQFGKRLHCLGKPEDKNTAFSVHAYVPVDYCFNFEKDTVYPGKSIICRGQKNRLKSWPGHTGSFRKSWACRSISASSG